MFNQHHARQRMGSSWGADDRDRRWRRVAPRGPSRWWQRYDARGVGLAGVMGPQDGCGRGAPAASTSFLEDEGRARSCRNVGRQRPTADAADDSDVEAVWWSP
jgi:hypothetical protein